MMMEQVVEVYKWMMEVCLDIWVMMMMMEMEECMNLVDQVVYKWQMEV